MESLTLYVLRSSPQGTGMVDAVENSTFTNLNQLCAASGVDPQAIAEFVSGGPLSSSDAIRLRGVLPGLSWAALAGATSPATTEHVRTKKCARQRRIHDRPPHPDAGPA